MSGRRSLVAAVLAATALVTGLTLAASPAAAAPPKPACAAQEPISIGTSGMMRTWNNTLIQVVPDAEVRCQFQGTLYSYYWQNEEQQVTITPDYQFWGDYQYINGQWTLFGIAS